MELFKVNKHWVVFWSLLNRETNSHVFKGVSGFSYLDNRDKQWSSSKSAVHDEVFSNEAVAHVDKDEISSKKGSVFMYKPACSVFMMHMMGWQICQVMFLYRKFPSKCALFVLSPCWDREGESPTRASYLTLQICINMEWMEQAALCCGWGKTSGVDEETEFKQSFRQPNKPLCFSSGSSNWTCARLCLLLLGNWVARLSRCDSSAAHYSSCCQRKRQQHQPGLRVVIIMTVYEELNTEKHILGPCQEDEHSRVISDALMHG